MNRPTSIAYASASPASSIWSKLEFYIRINARAILATLAFISFVLVFGSQRMQDRSAKTTAAMQFNKWGLRGNNVNHANFGGANNPGYFFLEDCKVSPGVYRFAAVTDLDQLSLVPEERKPTFRSVLLPGILRREPDGTYGVIFEPTRTLYSQHNEAGRGMELSELTLYQNRLLAFDDRTGTVFEILSTDGGENSVVVPRLVITEGDGDTDKGMKWEWASVKDSLLYIGSFGKEYTKPDGSIANTNNMWISIVDPNGLVIRQDWTSKYNFVREALGATSPGYIINEAVLWSHHMKKWLFLPRRVSSTAYDENEDERKGSNKLVLVDEDFTSAKVVDIEFEIDDPLHGFSTFAFVPETQDTHVLAIRSVEEDCVGGDENLCKQRSYLSVFEVLTGNVLMDEKEIHVGQDMKFEGIEFVNIYTKP